LYRYNEAGLKDKVTMDAFSARSNPHGGSYDMGVGSPEKRNRPPKAEPKIAHQVTLEDRAAYYNSNNDNAGGGAGCCVIS
jgi:hypothetical protein